MVNGNPLSYVFFPLQTIQTSICNKEGKCLFYVQYEVPNLACRLAKSQF